MFQTVERERLENLWRLCLKDARARYNLAATASKEASRVFIGYIPAPADGGANLISAIRAERAVRQQYIRTLQIFTDLIVRGVSDHDQPARI
jgi:hypothetical protein